MAISYNRFDFEVDFVTGRYAHIEVENGIARVDSVSPGKGGNAELNNHELAETRRYVEYHCNRTEIPYLRCNF